MVYSENKHMNDQFEIMIVGSGPAGISTWLYLHKYAPELAASTVIIEKEKHPRDKLCGGALQNCFVEKFLTDVNISLSIPKIDINSVKVKKENETFTLQNESFLSIIERQVFDNFLVEIARKRGASIVENASFVDLKREKEFLTVQTTNQNFKIKILVGADGALSNVRTKISNVKKISFAKTLEVFTPIDQNQDSEFKGRYITLDWSCLKNGVQGYIWHFPCIINNSSYKNIGLFHSRIHKPDTADVKKQFNQELEKNNILVPISLWKSHPISYYSHDKVLSDNRILLVGDAAGIEPLIGGGIHLSLLYGDVAAHAIINAFEKKDFSLTYYTKMVNNHLVGKFINNSVMMAKQVYSGRMHLLDTIKNNLNMMAKFERKEIR